MASPVLPKTHRALVLSEIGKDPVVQEVPFPECTPGSAVVRISVAGVLAYSRAVYDGRRQYPLPTPLTIGCSAVGRIVQIGEDATSLAIGQLVFVDCYLRGRDDRRITCLSGIHEGYSAGSKKLMHGEWRNSTYAEYAKAPLENCYPLNEKRLLGSPTDGGLGYRVEDLLYATRQLVPLGGLEDIGLKAGETIIIAPATGSFGGAAVEVALAMGARVIAAARTAESLERLAAMHERISTVQLTGDVATDTKALKQFGPVDAFQDWSPPTAAKTTHIKACMLALGFGGRVSLMGGIREDISVNYTWLLHNNITIKGKWMYTQEDPYLLTKMVETGVLKLGERAGVKDVGVFPLEDWSKAFTAAEENPGWGTLALIAP